MATLQPVVPSVSGFYITDSALADLAGIEAYGLERFGRAATELYKELISDAIVALAREPLRRNSRPIVERPGVRFLHIRHINRGHGVSKPRHIIIYALPSAPGAHVGILRVIRDAALPVNAI